jgi:biotin carboxylase
MRALLICYGQWHGPARLPRSLKRVGFEVGMVCRPEHMAAKTRFVDQFFLGNPKDDLETLRDLVNAIEAFRPTVIIPGLEPAVKALLEILRLHGEGKLPMLSSSSVEAIHRSIFDPAKQRYFHSKIDLLDALAVRGVRTPPQRELHTMGDADLFIQQHGYPVLLKPDEGFAGSGIAFCYTEDELFTALRERLKPGNEKRWCIQKLIDGPTAMLQYFAAEGKVKVVYSLLRLAVHPARIGPSSVVKLVENKEMEFAGEQLADLVRYNGCGSAQFALSEADGHAYMFEGNMRLGVSMHLGEVWGPDLCRGLFQHHSGIEIIQSQSNIGTVVALYPQEVIRDPNSDYLKGFVDKPTDDPELLAHFESMIEKSRK